MNKTELINTVAEANEITKKDSAKIVDSVFDAITAALKNGEKVQLMGFGSFETHTRAARTGINPRTKEPINIAESKSVAFKAGKALKDEVK